MNWVNWVINPHWPLMYSPANSDHSLFVATCYMSSLSIYSITRNIVTVNTLLYFAMTFQWRHNGRDDVSNHQPQDCLLNHLFRRGSKKTSKLRVTGLCAGYSPVTGEFPAQMASNAENVSISWRYNDLSLVDISYSSGPILTQRPKILWSLEAARIRLWHFHSLWNLTGRHLGSSTAEMPVQFQRSRGFAISR